MVKRVRAGYSLGSVACGDDSVSTAIVLPFFPQPLPNSMAVVRLSSTQQQQRKRAQLPPPSNKNHAKRSKLTLTDPNATLQ